MKNFFAWTVGALLFTGALAGDEFTDYANDPISFEAQDNTELPSRFWDLELDWNWITKAKFKSPQDWGESIKYSEGELNLAHAWFLNPCDGIALGAGYTRSYIDWSNNPYFSEKAFSKWELDTYAFTKRIPGWDWRLGMTAAFDTAHFDLYDYTIYDFLVWGRYGWRPRWCSPEIGLNLGLLARSGTGKNWIIPIVGFDIEQPCHWRVKFVYPVDMCAAYYLTDNCFLTLAGRIWNTRYRLSKNETLSKGIFEYRSSGIDMGVNFEYCYFHADVHMGATLGGGNVKIFNSNNQTVNHNKFKSSFYAGTTLSAKY